MSHQGHPALDSEEGRNALAWIADFVRAEGIDCDFRVNGRFHAAHNPVQYEKLAREIAAPRPVVFRWKVVRNLEMAEPYKTRVSGQVADAAV